MQQDCKNQTALLHRQGSNIAKALQQPLSAPYSPTPTLPKKGGRMKWEMS
ncbi:hypothetical protein HMPREF3034_00757 [Prevotella sp. DNF00663]|nr:hypothetical protein HMPREF3034_00757 [Prevotella sp. DNF00663]